MFQDIRNLAALVAKANALAKQKLDYLVPASSVTLTSGHNKSYLSVQGKSYQMKDRAARQLSEICSIPYNYYQMLGTDYPDLLDENVNTIIKDCDKNKLIRTLGGYARAILSDRYRKCEHEDLLQTIAPIITESKMSVASCSITDEKMYIKLVSTRTAKANVKVGDAISFGAIITNSEVGMSAISVIPYCMRLVCTNGMVLPAYSEGSRKIHLGKQLSSLEDEEAPDLDNIYTYVKDAVTSAVDPMNYMKVIDVMKAATEIKVSDPIETTEKVAKAYSLSPAEKSQVLFHLINDRDLSLFGLSNAVTRSGQDAINYTRATYLEEIGSKVLYDGIASIKSNRPDMLLLA